VKNLGTMARYRTVVVEPSRSSKHEASFITEWPGTLVKLVWDNSYSYFRSKTIKYRAVVLEVDRVRLIFR